jgi:tetratricopeptide (TPR) repeat protein
MRLEESEDVEEVAELHARYFSGFAEIVDRELMGEQQTTWLTRVEMERHNLRKALQWFDESGQEADVLRTAGALRWFWVIRRDVSEAARWLEKGIVAVDDADPMPVARALNGLGLISLIRLDFARAEKCFQESAELYESAGDVAGVARQHYHLAVTAWLRDDYATAVETAERALSMTREVGDHWAEAWDLAVWGTMARLHGDLETAATLMGDSHRVLSEHGGTLDVGWSHLRLAAIARDEGNYQRAASQYRAGRDLLAASGDVLGVAHADAGLGAISWLNGELEDAVDLYLGVLQGFGMFEEASNNLFELKTMIQGNPSTEELRRVVEVNRGRATRVEGAMGAKAAMAEYLYHMGKTAHRRMELDRAHRAITESLRLSIDGEDERGVAIALAALAVIAQQQDDPGTASRLFGLAEAVAANGEMAGWPPPDETGYHDFLDQLKREYEAFERERSLGAEMTPADALATAPITP